MCHFFYERYDRFVIVADSYTRLLEVSEFIDLGIRFGYGKGPFLIGIEVFVLFCKESSHDYLLRFDLLLDEFRFLFGDIFLLIHQDLFFFVFYVSQSNPIHRLDSIVLDRMFDFSERSLQESVSIYFRIAREVQYQSDVRTFGSGYRTDPAVLRRMHITDFERSSFSGQTSGA